MHLNSSEQWDIFQKNVLKIWVIFNYCDALRKKTEVWLPDAERPSAGEAIGVNSELDIVSWDRTSLARPVQFVVSSAGTLLPVVLVVVRNGYDRHLLAIVVE